MQALGLMAFLLIGGMLINALLSVLVQPAVQAAIEGSMPFIAGHLTTLTLVSGVILAFIVVAIPPLILNREREDGVGISAFEMIGFATAIAMGIASVGYLLSVGWVAATATL